MRPNRWCLRIRVHQLALLVYAFGLSKLVSSRLTVFENSARRSPTTVSSLATSTCSSMPIRAISSSREVPWGVLPVALSEFDERRFAMGMFVVLPGDDVVLDDLFFADIVQLNC